MKKYLEHELNTYGKSDYYPFHMPGHKRQMDFDGNPYHTDITEIDGFDNLHEAKGLIKEAEHRLAGLYGADASCFLVNGSTGGILSAISAAVKPGGRILIARNCHKAVYHAAYLRKLAVTYLYPMVLDSGILGAVSPEDVRITLERESGIEAVVLTSPTYDGIVSDVAAVADIVHAHGIPLIVDEAHGAHFGFHEFFPQTAVRLGADLVIQSMHKTLPAFTQSAVLHMRGGRIERDAVERYLHIYQTSSPSYLLMAGMDRCVHLLEEQADVLFDRYVFRLREFYERAQDCTHIEIMDFKEGAGDRRDASKLLIRAVGCGLSGKQLYNRLRDTYHLQMEMCAADYVLAMTSIMDSGEGFERLLTALSEIDKGGCGKYESGHVREQIKTIYDANEVCMNLSDAWDSDWEQCSLKEAAGRIAGDFVNLYPPGIPILVPGEGITERKAKQLLECLRLGLCVQGITDKMMITVVN